MENLFAEIQKESKIVQIVGSGCQQVFLKEFD